MDSDPEIEIIEKDSGMSSIGDSKDDTPERKEPVRVLMCGQWFVVKAESSAKVAMLIFIAQCC